MNAAEEKPPNDERAAVFGVSTWRGVYRIVLIFFVVWVVMLTLLPWLFR